MRDHLKPYRQWLSWFSIEGGGVSAGFVYFFQAPGGVDPVPLQAALLWHGLGLRFYQDADVLCEALYDSDEAGGANRLVLLSGSHASVCGAAAAVRRVDGVIAVVALLSAFRDRLLLQAMRSGIDACWPAGPAPSVVPGVLRFLGRAGQGGDVHTVGRPGWKLVSRAWLVQAPDGAVIPLTTAERMLMIALYQAPGRFLSHAAILQAIDHGASVQPEQRPAAMARRLSVLVSRLRRKFGTAGHDMPIRSVRGQGYELCADFGPPPIQAVAAAPVMVLSDTGP